MMRMVLKISTQIDPSGLMTLKKADLDQMKKQGGRCKTYEPVP